MAQTHATYGEVIDAGPLEGEWAAGHSLTLVKEGAIQISRLVLAKGHVLKPHRVQQLLVFQCLEGQMVFETMGRKLTLNPGDLCHIQPGEVHGITALEDSSALLTLFGEHADPSEKIGENP